MPSRTNTAAMIPLSGAVTSIALTGATTNRPDVVSVHGRTASNSEHA